MPIFQTMADYDKWRRRELRKKLLVRAAENSVVQAAAEAGGDSAFYVRYGNYQSPIVGETGNKGKKGTGKGSVLNPKGSKKKKGKSPAQRNKGPVASTRFLSLFDGGVYETGGFSYFGSSIEANYKWDWGATHATVVPKVPQIGTGGFTYAEPAQGSAEALELRHGQGYNDLVYIEYYVKGSSDGSDWDGTDNQSINVGFANDSNGQATGNPVGYLGIRIRCNGVFALETNYNQYGNAVRINDNALADAEVQNADSANGGGFVMGVLAGTDGTGPKVWTHVNGIWTTYLTEGGDPDDGGAGYDTGGSAGTHWMMPYVNATDAVTSFAGTNLEVTVVVPQFTPDAATVVVC